MAPLEVGESSRTSASHQRPPRNEDDDGALRLATALSASLDGIGHPPASASLDDIDNPPASAKRKGKRSFLPSLERAHLRRSRVDFDQPNTSDQACVADRIDTESEAKTNDRGPSSESLDIEASDSEFDAPGREEITAKTKGKWRARGATNSSHHEARDESEAQNPPRSSLEVDLSNEEGEAQAIKVQDIETSIPEATPRQGIQWLDDEITTGVLPLIYGFALSLTASTMLMVGVLASFLVFSTVSEIFPEYMKKFVAKKMVFFFYSINLLTGVINLMLLLWVSVVAINVDHIRRSTYWIKIILGSVLFALSVWAYWGMYRAEMWRTPAGMLSVWTTGEWPETFRGCEARVDQQQAALFSENIYRSQFTRVFHYDNGTFEIPKFNQSLSLSVQADQHLCYQGFQGNGDFYGVGTRVGLYLQLVSSLLANNLLPESRKLLQGAYLLFSLGICIATIVSSFFVTCVFSTEIEILYWMYWGGFICVFTSSPNTYRFGSEAKWMKLDWVFTTQAILHMLMIYHGIWFVWCAYDQIFSRMPCGTYHFFFAAFMDPSDSFWFLRDFLMQLICPLAFPMIIAIPITALLLAAEIKHSIQESSTYRGFFHKSEEADSAQQGAARPNCPAELSLFSRLRRRIKNACFYVGKRYRVIRREFGFPGYTRGGIRLVTPIDVKDRRNYRIRCGLFGATSLTISITAIETTLKWNRVVGVNSLTSSGQYLALIIGTGGFISTCWQIIQQEGRRRLDLRRRRLINGDIDGIELDRLDSRFMDAVRHAFAQPDVEFLTSEGALPISSVDIQEDEDRFTDSPSSSRRPRTGRSMSGPLRKYSTSLSRIGEEDRTSEDSSRPSDESSRPGQADLMSGAL